jgi:hypothetical protein
MGSTTTVKLKLHRRNVELDGERFAVLSLRPTTTARFATTEYHETVQILCDVEGAELIARLSWAMAFQSRKHTILLIDLPMIAKDPFALSPPAPILIVNSDLEAPSPAALAALTPQLPLAGDSEGSLRLMTSGFDRALTDVEHFWNQERAEDPDLKQHVHARWLERVGGTVVLAAPPAVLRHWAVRVAELASQGPLPADWTPAAEQRWTGEVKVLGGLGARLPE